MSKLKKRRELSDDIVLPELKEMYDKGIPLTEKQVAMLYEYGFLTKEEPKEIIDSPHIPPKLSNVSSLKDPSLSNNPLTRKADEITDITEDGIITLSAKKAITKDDWDIIKGDKFNIPESFCLWIDSINKGWKTKIYYQPFDYYCQQADAWIKENYNYSDQYTDEDKTSFIREEVRRMRQNTYYFAAKYGKLREGDIEGGGQIIKPYECQKVVWYLIDMGLNIGLIKSRQIGMTSANMLFLAKKAILTQSMFIKFVTEKDDKGIEIMEHKLKYPISRLPPFMKVNMHNDSDKKLSFMLKTEKGDISGVNSAIVTEAPYKTVIAGGSPQIVAIDEAGNIPILTEMIQDGRPTMFFNNHKTGKREFRRQLLYWGCVCAGTKVWTKDGRCINIEDLKKEDGIIGYNGKESIPQEINWFKPPTEKPCYRITTLGGNILECSEDHPLLQSRNKLVKNKTKVVTYTLAKDIKNNDQIITASDIPVFGTEILTHARTIGMLIGDGYYGKYNPQIGTSDNEIIKYLKDNYECHITESKSFITKSTKRQYEYLTIKSDSLKHILIKTELYGQTKDNKRLPKDIHKYNKESLCELLAGYFDTDGNICDTIKSRIVLTSVVYQLLDQTKHILCKLGIHSHILKENRKETNNKISKNQKNYVYRLYITSPQDIELFHKNITLLVGYKQNAIKNIVSKSQISKKKIDKAIFIINKDNNKEHYFIDDYVYNVRYETVKSVEFIGNKKVFNLNCSPNHNYIANGFITAQTGGEMDRGGGALESEWKKAFAYFNDRKFSNGIIPIFLDCFANPFFTEQDYDYEMAEAYATTGADADRAKIKFHQSYPRTIEDVFLRSPDTLIPMSDINKHIERINNSKNKPIFGYLEPIYDQSQPLPINSDTPFKIIGATFIPLSDKDIHRSTTTIFSLPDNLWSQRYYQGTDPIDTTSGYSNFASAIYDSLNNSFAAIINFRIPDYRYCYLQSLLLGLFYDPQAKNLIEINRGTPLKDFYISNGFRQNLLYNSMLPPNLQTPNSNEPYGIDKKAKRAEDILHQTKEMYDFMGHNIDSIDFFIQMKTFVRTLNKNGTSKYAVYDPKYFKDDVIDATTYAYINAKAHAHKQPIEKNKANKKIPKWRYSHENNQVTLKKILA